MRIHRLGWLDVGLAYPPTPGRASAESSSQTARSTPDSPATNRCSATIRCCSGSGEKSSWDGRTRPPWACPRNTDGGRVRPPYYLCCCRKEINQDDDYAVRETANYIAMVRRHFPQALVGDIEPYPFIPLADHIAWIEALQKRLAEMHVRGLDFYRLDVNWVEFTVFDRGSWPEVRKIERYCRQHKMAFSLIYWASGYPGFEKRGIADDSTWYTLLMAQGYAYAAVDGSPDHIMIESWLAAPAATLPETSPWTFTRSVRDFCDRFARPHPMPATTKPTTGKPG